MHRDTPPPPSTRAAAACTNKPCFKQLFPDTFWFVRPSGSGTGAGAGAAAGRNYKPAITARLSHFLISARIASEVIAPVL